MHVCIRWFYLNYCNCDMYYYLQKQSHGGVPVCTECLGTDARNRLGAAEDLICCYQCKSYAHPTCLDLLEHVSLTVVKVGQYVEYLITIVFIFLYYSN